MDPVKFNPSKIHLVDVSLPGSANNSVFWKNMTHYCDNLTGRAPVFFRALRALAAFAKHPSDGVVEDLERFRATLGDDMPFAGQNDLGEELKVWLAKTISDTVGLAVVKTHYNGDIGLFTMTRSMFKGRGLQSIILPRLHSLHPVAPGREVKELLPYPHDVSSKMLSLYRRDFVVGDTVELTRDITENGCTYPKGTEATIRQEYAKNVFGLGIESPGDNLTFVAGAGAIRLKVTSWP